MRNDNKLTEVIAFGLILIIFSIMGWQVYQFYEIFLILI
jgi:hypothetical protein